MYNVIGPFNTSAYLLIPTSTSIKGVTKKTYSTPENSKTINISFKTYGGTESIENGILSNIDTATIETWYNPNIKSDCRLKLCDDGTEWEIIGRPEDINMRHQWMKVKVRSVSGGA